MDSFCSNNVCNTNTTTTWLSGLCNAQSSSWGTFSPTITCTTTAGSTYPNSTYIGTSGYGSGSNTWPCQSCFGAGCSLCQPYQPPLFNFPPTPKPNVHLDTKFDDDEKEVLTITLGSKEKCGHKLHLVPGIEFYSPHNPPSRLRRFVLWLIFGFKWESTLGEQFIDAL